jgi:hypothetical protein
MVDVRVREPHRLQVDAQGTHRFNQARQLAAGIHDGRGHRLVAPDDGTVLLEACDWNGLVAQHGNVRKGKMNSGNTRLAPLRLS